MQNPFPTTCKWRHKHEDDSSTMTLPWTADYRNVCMNVSIGTSIIALLQQFHIPHCSSLEACPSLSCLWLVASRTRPSVENPYDTRSSSVGRRLARDHCQEQVHHQQLSAIDSRPHSTKRFFLWLMSCCAMKLISPSKNYSSSFLILMLRLDSQPPKPLVTLSHLAFGRISPQCLISQLLFGG